MQVWLHLLCLLFFKNGKQGKIDFREWVLIRFACSSMKFSFYGKDRIILDKENQANRYVSIYEIGGTTYEIETLSASLLRKRNLSPIKRKFRKTISNLVEFTSLLTSGILPGGKDHLL